jgi:hypothetical protein
LENFPLHHSATVFFGVVRRPWITFFKLFGAADGNEFRSTLAVSCKISSKKFLKELERKQETGAISVETGIAQRRRWRNSYGKRAHM